MTTKNKQENMEAVEEKSDLIQKVVPKPTVEGGIEGARTPPAPQLQVDSHLPVAQFRLAWPCRIFLAGPPDSGVNVDVYG